MNYELMYAKICTLIGSLWHPLPSYVDLSTTLLSFWYKNHWLRRSIEQKLELNPKTNKSNLSEDLESIYSKYDIIYIPDLRIQLDPFARHFLETSAHLLVCFETNPKREDSCTTNLEQK